MPVVLSGTNGVTFPDNSLQAAAASPYVLKNRIINGDFRIDQRNAGASVTPADNAYTLDRWQSRLSQASKYSVQQSSTAPTGFKNSLLVTSLSAYTVGASEFFQVRQIIEGYNVADLEFGAASAQTITISFWVRSSLTGTFGGVLSNSDGSRAYVFSYTINAANTFEQKSITIAGDTTGTWLTTSGGGFVVAWSLGAGSSVSTTAGAWNGSLFRGVTGGTSVVGTNGATWYITGIQLERNTTATPFEWIPYGTELALCQRYFQVFGNISGNGSIGAFNPIGQGQGVTTNSAGQYSIFLPVSMRTSPSIGISTTASAFSVTSPSDGNTACTSVPTANIGGPNMIRVAAFCTTAGFMTVGAGNILFANSSTPAWVSAAAEL